VKVSVVIPAFEEAEQIAGAIASAAAEADELIVVDGDSSDATPERAAACGARVIRGLRGRAAQLEAGRRAAAGDVLLFLHADTRLPAGWRAAVETVLASPGTVGGAFRLRFDRRSPALRVVEGGARLRALLFGMPYGDQALFCRREALAAAGGVPQTPILEDLDLVRALRAQGRLARIPLPATTSARRYLSGGVLRTMLRHWTAALGWLLGVDRARLAAWYRR
jgi:rSAM/selenodomain-associated transferase 2